MPGGFVGVDIFFVISGFLITTILIESLENNKFNLKNFYIKRINRLFPALLLVLAVCIIFGWFVLFPIEYQQLGTYVAGGASFISNFVLLLHTGYFDTAAETKPLLHLWSLGIEEQFYIFWPVLIWLTWKSRFNLLTIIVLIFVVSFVCNLNGVQSNPTTTFFAPHTRFWELLFGSILAYLMCYKQLLLDNLFVKLDYWLIKIVYKEPSNINRLNSRTILSILGFLIIFYGIVRFTKELAYPGGWALAPTFGALLIILSGPNAWVNRKIFSNKFAVWIGLVSYPLYLWHWPLLAFARVMEENTPSRTIRIILIFLSFILAWATYHWIEKPLSKAKSNIKPLVLIVLMFTVGSMGLITQQLKGMDFRLNNLFAAQALIAKPSPELEKYYQCASAIDTFKGLSFNGGCHLSKDTNPEFMFIGDSHASHYESAVWKLLASKSIMFIVQTSCLPFSSDSLLQESDCKMKYDAVISFLKSNKSVKKVYISGFWSYLMTGDFSERGVNWRHAKPVDEIRSKSFIENGRRFINDVLQSGKDLVFLRDIPDLDFDINACFDSRPLRLTKANIINKESCAIDFSNYKKRMAEYNKIIDQVLQGFSQITVYDPLPLFCNKNKCVARDDVLPYYFNGDHLNYHGATKVIKDLLNKTERV